MKKTLLLVMQVLFMLAGAAQTKVAQYSVGKKGTDKYEHFEFVVKDGNRWAINYSYGKNNKETKLQYAGKEKVNRHECFKIRFANNYVLYITPKESQLQVKDATGKYNKTFSWEYEGPVNGIGTYCETCAESSEDAMKLIVSFFLK